MNTFPSPAAAAADAPEPTLAARHRVTLALPATVGDLRAAIRRMNATDRITDVWIANAAGEVSLEGLAAVELTVTVTA